MTALRPALAGFLVLLITTLACAQEIGDSAAAVINACGNPMMKKSSAAGEVWAYSNGLRVTLQDGVVTAVNGRTTSTPASAGTSTTVSRNSADSDDNASNMTVISVPKPKNAPAASAGPELSGIVLLGAVACLGVYLIGQIMILVAAFREGVLWGLGCFFLPVVQLIFIIVHWHEAKKGLGLSLLGLGAAVGITATQGLL